MRVKHALHFLLRCPAPLLSYDNHNTFPPKNIRYHYFEVIAPSLVPKKPVLAYSFELSDLHERNKTPSMLDTNEQCEQNINILRIAVALATFLLTRLHIPQVTIHPRLNPDK